MIERFISNGRAEFMQSEMVQESVIRCYEVIIGEIVKRLDETLITEQAHIPWTQIAGFRDFLIHNCDRVNLEIVWNAIQDDLQPLKQAVQSMLQQVEQADDRPED